MKGIKSLLTIILFTFISFNSLFAYQPVFKTTTWFTSYMALGGYGSDIYVLEKDTFISQQKCYIVSHYKSGYRIGIFKEDSSTKKVFVYENNAWRIIYDFSLAKNHRVTLKINGVPTNMRVYETDTIECFGIKRKVIKLIGQGYPNPYEVQWIEGIGSNQGLMYDDYTHYCVSYYLNCAYQGLNRVYCYNNFIYPECPELPINLSVKNNCSTDSVSFELDLIRNPLEVTWDFGDTIHKQTTVNQLNVKHKYSFGDSFRLSIRFFDTTVQNTVYFYKWIHIDKPEYEFLTSDTILCAKDTLLISPTSSHPDATYYWHGDISNRHFITQPITKSGTYVLQQQIGACSPTYDTVRVILIPKKWVYLGTDKYVCEGETIRLTVQQGYESLLWSSGDTTQNLTVSNSGNVWVKASYSGCELVDTINILYLPLPTFSAVKDTSLCLGDSILLSADTSGGNKVVWWDNSIHPVKEFKNGGSYWVNISNANCSVKNTFTIEGIKMPAIDLGRDTIVCKTDPLLFTANSSYPVMWFTGDTGESITVTPPAVVWVKSFNKQCIAIDTIKLAIKEKTNINAGNIDWCFWEEPYIIDLTEQGFSNYKFTIGGGQQDTVFSPETVTRVIEDKDGCKADYQLTVNSLCDENIYVPTAFTPNADGLNDFFHLQHPMLKAFRTKVSIYNGYGELVFASESPDFAWDGTYKGVDLPTGVYLVLMNIQMKNGRKSIYHGNLTLLR